MPDKPTLTTSDRFARGSSLALGFLDPDTDDLKQLETEILDGADSAAVLDIYRTALTALAAVCRTFTDLTPEDLHTIRLDAAQFAETISDQKDPQ